MFPPALAKRCTVTGMEITTDKFEYRVTDGQSVWIVPDEHAFLTEEDVNTVCTSLERGTQ